MADIKAVKFTQPLSLSFRPRTFDQMIGAELMVKKIRGRMTEGREPAAWLFTGNTGAGKTTAARILAVSLQCTHQDKFGNPCDECYAKRKQFDITEINASDTTKVEDFRRIFENLINYSPFPGSRRKVIILDELHKASDSSQNYLLKPFEDCPKTTVWICCTTAPDKIIPTLRRRCAPYVVPRMELESTRRLIKTAIKRVGGTRDSEDLAEALLENTITSPGLVLNAVEKYLEDPSCSPEDAAKLDGVSEIDISDLIRAVVKGLWPDVAKWLRNCNSKDAPQIRNRLVAYLREMLLNDVEFGDRNDEIADVIEFLVKIQFIGEETQVAAIAAAAYKVSRKFRRPSKR